MTVPLCLRCHDRVHDRERGRTDTLAALARDGRAGLGRLRKMLDRRHREVMAIFQDLPTGIRPPPQLVKIRTVHGQPYEEWVPWLDETSAVQQALAAKMQAVDWGY